MEQARCANAECGALIEKGDTVWPALTIDERGEEKEAPFCCLLCAQVANIETETALALRGKVRHFPLMPKVMGVTWPDAVS